jgi:GDP-L-fucose synthase
MNTVEKKTKVYIAGIDGMIGRTMANCLELDQQYSVIGTNQKAVNLLNYQQVFNYLQEHCPDVIVLAAAKVGGGHAILKQPVEFLEDNIVMQMNVMRAAKENNIKKVIFLASSALYPTDIMNPISEEDILKGKLDSVQESYGLAKLVGLHQTKYYNAEYKCKFTTAVLNNVIGNKDNGQVVYSLLKQMRTAQSENQSSITIWGTGTQRREFIFAEDVANAIKILIENYDNLDFDTYNIGVQSDISIKELAYMIKEIAGYDGELIFDHTKPEGVKKRVLDSSRIFSLGFRPETTLFEGIQKINEKLV